jgi:hypothetical protein
VPTTSPLLAQALLEGLSETGHRFAILHGEANAAAGEVTSDVDVGVADPPTVVLRRLAERMAPLGLRLVVVWPYDAYSVTSFWMSGVGGDGVQLDLTGDLRGDSAYGLRTGVLLEHSVPGVRWNRLTGDAEHLYLLSKRDLKGDRNRVTELVDVDPQTLSGLLLLSERAVASWRRPRMQALLQGAPQFPPVRTGPRRTLSTARRRAGRVLRPIGHRIVLRTATPAVAGDVAATLSRVVPSSVASVSGGPGSLFASYRATLGPHLVLVPRLAAPVAGAAASTVLGEVIELAGRRALQQLASMP